MATAPSGPQSLRRGLPTPHATEDGLRVAQFRAGGDEFVVVSEPIVGADVFAALTQAEREVARLVADGSSNQAIAEKRGARPQTVANQLAAIYRKLAVSSRSGVIARLVDLQAERRGHQRRP